MDHAIVEAQLLALQAQLALEAPGSVQWSTTQAQITVLENEIAVEPIVPPIFGPHMHPHGR